MAPLDASLLTMTAGRVFLTSEPIAGSKSTHQTSPRFIDAPDQALRPGTRLVLARCIPCRLAILGRKILLRDMRAGEIFDELADAAASYDPVQAFVYRIFDQYRKLFAHGRLLRDTYDYTYSACQCHPVLYRDIASRGNGITWGI